jgi:hypothetical protein
VTAPDVWRAFGALCEAPEPEHARLAEALGLPEPPTPEEHTEVFLFQSYPYASVHLGDEGMMGGEARERVAGFWRALGLVPPAEPDHLAALLGLYASLAELEAREDEPARRLLRREARTALLWEHLLSWATPFLRSVRAAAGPAYASWATTLEEALAAEATALEAPARLPLALREAAEMPSPDEGVDAFVSAVLAPVRSGFVLTRDRVATIAREGGLGLRAQSRTSALRSLLEQDPGGTLRRLSAEAERWGAIHRSTRAPLGDIARFWEERAEAAAARFLDASSVAEEVMAGAPGN